MKCEHKPALYLDGSARHAVRADHRRPHIRVTKQRLNGADIVVRLQEMGREGVSEGVCGYAFL